LEEYKNRTENDGEEGWEVASDDEDDDNEGWINVQDSESNQSISMSDNEEDSSSDAWISVDHSDKIDVIHLSDENDDIQEDQDDESDEGSDEEEKIVIEDKSDEKEKNTQTSTKENELISEIQTGTQIPKPEKGLHLDSQRILTPKDFELLKQLKSNALQNNLSGNKRKDRPSNTAESGVEMSNIVEPSTIEGYRKKKRMTKDERKQTVLSGREERPVYASNKSRKEKKGGTTNEKKLRNKPFILVKHKRSIREKQTWSAKQTQRASTEHGKKIRNQKKFKH